jgi:hypothetical protein
LKLILFETHFTFFLANDNKVLQFALTLENLDASYFDYFQTAFNKSAFIAAGYAGSVWDAFDLIRMHEEVTFVVYKNSDLKVMFKTYMQRMVLKTGVLEVLFFCTAILFLVIRKKDNVK